MKKMNNKSIFLGLKILSISVFSLLVIPTAALAAYGTNYSFSTGNDYEVEVKNPTPGIDSISPKSSNLGVGTKTITIIGGGFIPSSIARVNGSNRPTTFIDDSHLFIQTNGNDMYTYRTNGGFYITVFNGTPGGGYSNAVLFVVKSSGSPATNNGGSNLYPDTFQEINPVNENPEENSSNLVSGAVFGSNSFLPSGLIQWVLLAIIILLIVIFARRVFGAKETYDESPMKHA